MEVSTEYELTEEGSSIQKINIEKVETIEIRDEDVIQGTALLRLYCALKRLAGMKLSQQESEALLHLVTCHPPPTAAGVRFVVVGLCTLLVCTNIMRYVFITIGRFINFCSFQNLHVIYGNLKVMQCSWK